MPRDNHAQALMEIVQRAARENHSPGVRSAARRLLTELAASESPDTAKGQEAAGEGRGDETQP
jgi:hypothetical protein